MTIRARCTSLLLATLAFSTLAIAAPPKEVRVNSSVPYFNDGVGSAEIRRQCDWNTKLIAYLVDEADDVVVNDDSASNVGARVLKMTITSVQAGSRTYARDNWVHMRGALLDGNTVVAQFEARTQMEVLQNVDACEVLDGFAEQLGEAIADWVDDPEPNARLGQWR